MTAYTASQLGSGSIRAPRVLAVVFAVGIASGCGSVDTASYRTVAGGDAARGKVALEHYGCGSCHVIPGVRAAEGMVGPPLIWFGRRTVIAGEVANTSDQLIRWIIDPSTIEPNTAMPNVGVTPQDARDMAAYLYTLH